MATQIIQVDLESTPPGLQVRDDVRSILVVFYTADGPVGCVHVPRPAGGILQVPAGGLGTRVAPPAERRDDVALQRSDEPLSIVICTHERPDDLHTCLEALARVMAPGDEVIVVDNNPRTGRTGSVVSRHPARYVVEPVAGLNRARNAGVLAATRGLVAFVDDDVVVTTHWRHWIGSAFTTPRVACATGLVLPLELETGAQEEFEAFSAHRRTFEARVFSRASGLAPSRADVVGIGANMAFRRDVLVRLDGFDPRLDAGTCTRAGGDTEMFARVIEAGFDVVYVPRAQVWHRHRRTSREVVSCAFGYGVGTFSMLTKRLVERGDFGALETAARWVVGTALKAVRLRVMRQPAPRWSVNVAEWFGALSGPFCFAYETWRTGRSHAGRLRAAGGHVSAPGLKAER